jgi:hypothetical protein
MPAGNNTIVFARIVPSELNIVTTENNNVIDLALCIQLRSSSRSVPTFNSSATGNDIWQNKQNATNILSWSSFVESFYGGGDGDFGVSQVAGRQLTMIGVSGEYANGVPQASSALTHMADRARTDSSQPPLDATAITITGHTATYAHIYYDVGPTFVVGQVLTLSGFLEPSFNQDWTVQYTHGGINSSTVTTLTPNAAISSSTGQAKTGSMLRIGRGLTVSGVSVLNDVIDSIVYDLGVPHEAWDSCSYMNVVEQLQDVHTLSDVTRVQGKVQQTCALSMSSLVHEIASNYDENMGFDAANTGSAVGKLYSGGQEAAIATAMAGSSANSRHVLVLSVMFKNSTPGVRNIEFRIHFIVSNSALMAAQSAAGAMLYAIDGGSGTGTSDLQTLCSVSANPLEFQLDGSQT